MKLFLLNVVCLGLLIFSCSPSKNSKNQAGKSISVEVDESADIRFSDVFEKIEYVPLETTESSLIGGVERLRIFGDKVCIVCDKSLLIFNKDTGRNETRISKSGNAPGEYLSLYDVYFDKRNGIIELLDMNGRKIQKYDSKGIFKESQELPFMAFSFNKDKEGDYWFYNNNMVTDDIKSKVICLDSDTKEISGEYFPIDFHLSSYFFVIEGNNFVRRGDGMLFFSCPFNQIYSMNKGSDPVLAYNIDFGKHTAPDEFYKESYSDIMDFSTKANKLGYVYFINNFHANNTNLLLSFMLEKNCFWNLYSIADGKSKTGHYLVDDVNSLSRIPIDHLNTFFAMDEETLYFLLSAEQFMEMCEDNEDFIELVDHGIDEQSNPILVKCKFKKTY